MLQCWWYVAVHYGSVGGHWKLFEAGRIIFVESCQLAYIQDIGSSEQGKSGSLLAESVEMFAARSREDARFQVTNYSPELAVTVGVQRIHLQSYCV